MELREKFSSMLSSVSVFYKKYITQILVTVATTLVVNFFVFLSGLPEKWLLYHSQLLAIEDKICISDEFTSVKNYKGAQENYEKLLENEFKNVLAKKCRLYITDNELYYSIALKKLGDCYIELGKDGDDELIHKGISNYRRSLLAFESKVFPYFDVVCHYNALVTKNDLGMAFLELSKKSDKLNNLSEAEKRFSEVKTGLDIVKYPVAYIRAQNGLMIVYGESSSISGMKDSLLSAEEIYNSTITDTTIAGLYDYYSNRYPNPEVQRHNEPSLDRANIRDVIRDCKCGPGEELLRKDFLNEYYGLIKGHGDIYLTFSNTWSNKENLAELPKAIEDYKKALTYITRERSPNGYAKIHNNLGIVYSILAESRDTNKNADLVACKSDIDNSISHFQKALVIWNRTSYPAAYAYTNGLLGDIYLFRSEISNADSEDIDNARKRFIEARDALEGIKYPYNYNYGKNKYNIANTYKVLAKFENTEENLSSAINLYIDALDTFDVNNYPYDYAQTYTNLGDAYLLMSNFRKGEDKEVLLDKAIMSYKNAQEIFTEKSFSRYYDMLDSYIKEAEKIKKLQDS